jgi:hypothetical protein
VSGDPNSKHEREDDIDCVSKTFHLKTQPEYFQKLFSVLVFVRGQRSEVRGQQREHTLTFKTKISYNKNIRDGVFYKDANMDMSWTLSLKYFRNEKE